MWFFCCFGELYMQKIAVPGVLFIFFSSTGPLVVGPGSQGTMLVLGFPVPSEILWSLDGFLACSILCQLSSCCGLTVSRSQTFVRCQFTSLLMKVWLLYVGAVVAKQRLHPSQGSL